jgi:hypothetical protein
MVTLRNELGAALGFPMLDTDDVEGSWLNRSELLLVVWAEAANDATARATAAKLLVNLNIDVRGIEAWTLVD